MKWRCIVASQFLIIDYRQPTEALAAMTNKFHSSGSGQPKNTAGYKRKVPGNWVTKPSLTMPEKQKVLVHRSNGIPPMWGPLVGQQINSGSLMIPTTAFTNSMNASKSTLSLPINVKSLQSVQSPYMLRMTSQGPATFFVDKQRHFCGTCHLSVSAPHVNTCYIIDVSAWNLVSPSIFLYYIDVCFVIV